MIIGNPNIKTENKPGSIEDLYTMSWEVIKAKKEKKLTPDELESIKQELLAKLNK